MATQLQLTLRRDEAYQRIDAATRKLEKSFGVRHKGGGDIRHRDPQIEQILRIEAIADSLDALVQAQGKSEAEQPPVTVETVKAEPLKTTETVEVVAADTPKARAKSK